ncbi:PREDICTED: nuclear polyadenylated RNA-binding protein 3-like [Ipomoea nil]|uniref:nuclear polyadenylated RNA-binding protein 3-like n=1 Tax=Ipomoea nil TaxID=35883 RepID=UPI000900D66C|nr:PREDICTED: nuclear polyadenylated RNA-binding protein 3-like [Ipomoea nil]
MQDEEAFALEWISTDDISKALRIEEINRVFSYKMTNRTLGRDKAPIYEDEDDNDVGDADDENDDDDDDDGDNNDQLGNVGAQEADPEDSHTFLIGPDYDTYPQRSPLRKLPSDSDDSEEVSTNHPEDLSRAIVPHIQPMDETPIMQEKATVREGKLEASPILLSSASGGKWEAPPQDDHMDTSPTNIEEESTAESPRTIMNLMRETVHSAETIHKQYLALRETDTKVMDDLCKKVNFLIATQSQPRPPPPAQPQPQQQSQSDHKILERMTKKLYDLEAALNKVARQQHEIKHSHFGLK